MTVTLRVVLDQVTDVADPDAAEAAEQITRALVQTAPTGCAVGAVVPAGGEDAARALGVSDVTVLPLTRPRLAASWRLGIAPGVGGGLIHAPTPAAPLVRHDRVNENDQTVVTMWDLCAWESPDGMPRSQVRWHHAMLRRAERHADAVVVPTHAMAARLDDTTSLGGRIRVIAGAAPEGFATAATESGTAAHELPFADGYVVVAAARCDDGALATALSAVASLPEPASVLALDLDPARADRVAELARDAGLDPDRVRGAGWLAPAERAAVMAGASALLAPSALSAFPWRVVDALTLGLPVVALDSEVHREVVVDGGLLAPAPMLGESLAQVLASDQSRRRYRVRAADRGHAFSWRDHAERVWALHAEL